MVRSIGLKSQPYVALIGIEGMRDRAGTNHGYPGNGIRVTKLNTKLATVINGRGGLNNFRTENAAVPRFINFNPGLRWFATVVVCAGPRCPNPAVWQ